MSENLAARDWMSLALWLAGAGHFVVLLAGSQVPHRLGWKNDLPKLLPFNRKLLWTYWAFTGMTIAAFGTLTLVLHQELLEGNRAALALAAFISIYWAARIGVDAVYFSHREWPRGLQFVVGHALLTGLFLFLFCTYASLLIWHA